MTGIGVSLFKRILTFIFVFCWLISFAQINPARSKGEVFKHRPEKPTENINYSGLIIVKKTMYGLIFEDKQLSSEVKNRVERFFKRRLNGYTDLKTYQLKVYRKHGKWYVDNTEI
ncbi:hypothetical protein [Chryseobacterium sp. G0240]|uniref:hypothetical protein n=1 Tax=Chryseobacterium sp. G0240 TaxID=2487066 RepID=UPI0011CEBB0E|nr:hypothetical protein [Chryseobacterium sp. G0240]